MANTDIIQWAAIGLLTIYLIALAAYATTTRDRTAKCTKKINGIISHLGGHPPQ